MVRGMVYSLQEEVLYLSQLSLLLGEESYVTTVLTNYVIIVLFQYLQFMSCFFWNFSLLNLSWVLGRNYGET